MGTVFLDRDGVINRKLPEGRYVSSWEEFEFLPGVFEALRRLKQRGFRLILVTNQRGIALGKLDVRTLEAIHKRMQAKLESEGATLDAIYYCPHAENTCDCRKPGVGLFLRAKQEFASLDFTNSFLVGDSPSDIEAGIRLGCRTVLIASNPIDTPAGLDGKNMRADYLAASLLEAVEQCILPQTGITKC
jgi:D-glycero-D-manno-heptose 1,7-bisphosphate phosphatase